ncbi:hypothetical protein BDR06DRAFT_973359 [Suillus hirtellus]|nr:hypothetical protein BDR06DRAFT_973359 [Suillus hirtellus]
MNDSTGEFEVFGNICADKIIDMTDPALCPVEEEGEDSLIIKSEGVTNELQDCGNVIFPELLLQTKYIIKNEYALVSRSQTTPAYQPCWLREYPRTFASVSASFSAAWCHAEVVICNRPGILIPLWGLAFGSRAACRQNNDSGGPSVAHWFALITDTVGVRTSTTSSVKTSRISSKPFVIDSESKTVSSAIHICNYIQWI